MNYCNLLNIKADKQYCNCMDFFIELTFHFDPNWVPVCSLYSWIWYIFFQRLHDFFDYYLILTNIALYILAPRQRKYFYWRFWYRSFRAESKIKTIKFDYIKKRWWVSNMYNFIFVTIWLILNILSAKMKANCHMLLKFLSNRIEH